MTHLKDQLDQYFETNRDRIAQRPPVSAEIGERVLELSGVQPQELRYPRYNPEETERGEGFDRLTSLEQTVLDKLPGLADNGFVRAVSSFGETPVGSKLFNALSWMSENTERLLGTAYQMSFDSDFDLSDVFDPSASAKVRAAWEASSSFYETIAPKNFGLIMPLFSAKETLQAMGLNVSFAVMGKTKEDMTPEQLEVFEEWESRTAENREWMKRVFEGAAIPDVGGLPELVAHREAILAGADPEEVKASYMDSMGLLALRSQIWDTAGQVVLDPLNLLLPKIRPIERTHAMMQTIRGARPTMEFMDLMDEFQKVADGVVDLERLSELAAKVDALPDDVAKIIELGKKGEDMTSAARAVLDDFDTLSKMSLGERMVAAVFNADPFNRPPAIEKLSKIPLAGKLVNVFTLTPESRAALFIQSAVSGIGNQLAPTVKNVTEWTNKVRTMAAGAFGPKLGAFVVTPIGQRVAPVLKGVLAQADELEKVWDATRTQRKLLEEVGQLLGDDVVKIARKLEGGGAEAKAIFDKLQSLAQSTDAAKTSQVLSGIMDGSFTRNTLESISEVLKSVDGTVIPLTQGQFRDALLIRIAETAGGITGEMFQITEKGWFNKVTDAVKSAESLLLLGGNPVYPFQNLFNNEFTLVARGLFAPFSRKYAQSVASDFGFTSARWGEGFTIAGEKISGDVLGTAVHGAINEIRDGKPGMLKKFTDMMSKPKLFRATAQSFESLGRQRGMMKALLTVWPRIRRNITKFDDISPGLADALDDFGRGVAGDLFTRFKAARKPEDIEDIMRSIDVSFHPDTILKRVAEDMGEEVDYIGRWIDNDLLEVYRQGMKKLVSGDSRPTARQINTLFDKMRKEARALIDANSVEAIPIRLQEAFERAKLEGPQALVRSLGEMGDEIVARHRAHMGYLEQRWSDIHAITNRTVRNRLTKALLEESDVSWNRTWNWVEAGIDGTAKGLREAGVEGGDELQKSFATLRKASEDFIGERNRLFESLGEKKYADLASFEESLYKIYDELDAGYQSLMDVHESAYKTMDDILVRMMGGDEAQQAISGWRAVLRQMRRSDMKDVLVHRRNMRGMTQSQKADAWRKFLAERSMRQAEIGQMEQYGRFMMEGDGEAAEFLAQFADELPDVGRAADDVSVLTRGEVARIGQSFVADSDKVLPPQPFYGLASEEAWLSQGAGIVDAIHGKTLSMLDEPAKPLAGLPDDARALLRRYADHAIGQINDDRHIATRMSEGMTDAAMLNYSRQYGFDAGAFMIFPYQFWFTHSIARWLLHSVDRPQMLATWAKIQEGLDNVVGDKQNFPSRLRGRVQLDLPFTPEHMGQTWVDPFRSLGIPFGHLTDAYTSWQEELSSKDARIERWLDSALQAGQITADEYNGALDGTMPEIRQRAEDAVLEEGAFGQSSPLDFISLAYSPHLPIQMALKIARGEEEDLSPLPPTRMLKNVAGLLGISPGVYNNTWGNIRQHFGLPAFDQWEDYRIDRELSNMAAEGIISTDEALIAMIERKGENFDLAEARVTEAGGFTSLARMLGLPTQPFPEGEQRQRELQGEFIEAIELRDAGDPSALTRFFEEHPEYEARLALWDAPAERLQQFLIDEIWDKWHGLTRLEKRQVRDQLGDDFDRGFLDQDIAMPGSLEPSLLAGWLKVLGGDPPGTLGDNAIPLDLAPKQTAIVAEMFYSARNIRFPNWFEQQSNYYDLAEGDARRDYLSQTPELRAYWDFRRDFLRNNPEAASYIDDKFEPEYASFEEAQRAFSPPLPQLTDAEIQIALGTADYDILVDFLDGGFAPPSSVVERIAQTAEDFGITYTQFIEVVARAISE